MQVAQSTVLAVTVKPASRQASFQSFNCFLGKSYLTFFLHHELPLGLLYVRVPCTDKKKKLTTLQGCLEVQRAVSLSEHNLTPLNKGTRGKSKFSIKKWSVRKILMLYRQSQKWYVLPAYKRTGNLLVPGPAWTTGQDRSRNQSLGSGLWLSW